jgi:hypothetical protein
VHKLNRRDALQQAAGAGMLAALAPQAAQAQAEPGKEDQRKLDRKSVPAAGLTEAEADCWELTAQLAGKPFELPQLHPMDRQEIATTIHVIQYRLLSRPSYRKYKDAMKELSKKP